MDENVLCVSIDVKLHMLKFSYSPVEWEKNDWRYDIELHVISQVPSPCHTLKIYTIAMRQNINDKTITWIYLLMTRKNIIATLLNEIVIITFCSLLL